MNNTECTNSDRTYVLQL